jgi:signal peptidase I
MLRGAWLRRVVGCLATVALILLVAGCGASESPAARSGPYPSPKRQLASLSVFRYRVPSGSMEPTLRAGQEVTVVPGSPRVGAIVVYYPPEGFATEECGPKAHVVKPGGAACAIPLRRRSSLQLIKRIVAGPGDEIYIREGHVYRKARGESGFNREDDAYTRACGLSARCSFPVPIKIGTGRWFLMGDNRRESDDSRFWGPVQTNWIVGAVSTG